MCGVDRLCGQAVHCLMMRLVEKGLARRFKKGNIRNREGGGGGGLNSLEGVDMTATAKKIKLSGRIDVGVWYEYVRVGMGINQYDVFCGVVVNGVKLK